MSSFANKKVRRDLSGHHQQPPMKGAYHHQVKTSEMKLKKTNPRLASVKGTFASDKPGATVNQRKGKQLKKMESKEHQRHQVGVMQYPAMHMPQYPM